MNDLILIVTVAVTEAVVVCS